MHEVAMGRPGCGSWTEGRQGDGASTLVPGLTRCFLG